MRSTRPRAKWRGTRAALATAALAAGGLALASQAQAAYTTASCSGAAIAGRGASFQQIAQNAFQFDFSKDQPDGCGSTAANVSYDPAGSGAGRRSLGERSATANQNGSRDLSVRFAGTDEPPTGTQRSQIETGETLEAGGGGGDRRPDDNGRIHTIPVAVGAIVLTVNWPNDSDGTLCTIGAANTVNGPAATSGTARATTSKTLLEQAFAGDAGANQWGELFTTMEAGINPGDCAGKKITRVVREDSSGTTFSFKQWLETIDNLDAGTTAIGWSTLVTGAGASALGNTEWPRGEATARGSTGAGNTTIFPAEPNPAPGKPATIPASDPSPLIRGAQNPGVASQVLATEGSIGYVDLATARGVFFKSAGTGDNTSLGTDDKFWLSVPNNDVGVSAVAGYTPEWEPTFSATGATNATSTGGPAAQRGANCRTQTFAELPATTLGDWSRTNAANSADGYGICALTYVLAFDDDARVYNAINNDYVGNERRSRTTKDYLTKSLDDPTQDRLNDSDYSEVGAGAQNLIGIARAGVNEISFDKAGVGPPGGGNTGGGNTGGGSSGGGSGGGGGSTTTNTGGTTVTPAPEIPLVSNVFTVASARVAANGTTTLTVQAPGPGTFRAVSSAQVRVKRGRRTVNRTIRVGSASAVANAAGPVTLTIAASRAAKAQQKRSKFRSRITLTFTPAAGGAPSEQTRNVTLKKTRASRR